MKEAKSNTNHLKKMAKLRYRELMLELRNNDISFNEITQIVNRRLAHTNLKIKLSTETVRNFIKQQKNN